MKIFFLIFFFFLISNNKNVSSSNENNFDNPNNFLVLSKIKITSLYYIGNKREEKNILSRTIEENENSYILIDKKVSFYDMINISCSFKIKKDFDKAKLRIILIKNLMGNNKEYKNSSYDIKELKKNETFIFTNEFRNNLVISNLSILVVNMIALNGYYNFDIFITDGNNYIKIPFIKIFLHFYNNISITKYPIKKENMIIMLTMRKYLIRNYKKNLLQSVVYNYRYYYSLPLVQENKNYEKYKQIDTKLIILFLLLMAYLFIVYIYLIFIYLKYNIKNIHTNYCNYVFIFSLMSIMFLFILYDLFFNIIQISYIFIFSFTFFLVIFYKTLISLREFRKCE
ncbi:conserved Plasmodium protein, unknown function [Plasmodium relictum]|uniref:Dolichyl-diphosphooligosaccharide--protein glycosyltransferase subunit 2 n=1 Tax=Plasmodium relictum TaxID=85471 RepID=A0A1J1HAE1_PLARL|nr:conserved Plasmodium protein, unknown function [Plasmodium relictum]CRH00402.1 conserved Plasmodium protein, unknown function [Plasmodium relictum]